MGQDKANLEVDGEPLAPRIASSLASAGYPVTVLGREPVPGFPFQLDAAEYEGPLTALSAYKPNAETIFVAACDMPRFDSRVVDLLSGILARSPDAEAAIPIIEGRRQPLCGLYRRTAWTLLPDLRAAGRKSMMAWLDSITVREVFESELQDGALDPNSIRSVNSIEELDELLNSPQAPTQEDSETLRCRRP